MKLSDCCIEFTRNQEFNRLYNRVNSSLDLCVGSLQNVADRTDTDVERLSL